MKTEKEINQDILKITTTIQEKFPELGKYIEETPAEVTEPASADVNVKNLEDYHESLNVLLKNYITHHDAAIK